MRGTAFIAEPAVQLLREKEFARQFFVLSIWLARAALELRLGFRQLIFESEIFIFGRFCGHFCLIFECQHLVFHARHKGGASFCCLLFLGT